MRINKYLAKSGIGSRRSVERFINEERVSLNGRTVSKLSTDIKDGDIVQVDGKLVVPLKEDRYYLLNKPIGYTSTTNDPFAEKTVMDLFKDRKGLFPVGRLDKNSRGLMIITNDGDFSQKMTHPRYGCEKEYMVKAKRAKSEFRTKIDKLLRFFKCGAVIDGYRTAPANIKLVAIEGGVAIFNIVIKEGKKRQIRKIFNKAGIEIIDLLRVRMGQYKLGSIKEGEYIRVEGLDKR